jgi:hypothetical protein
LKKNNTADQIPALPFSCRPRPDIPPNHLRFCPHNPTFPPHQQSLRPTYDGLHQQSKGLRFCRQPERSKDPHPCRPYLSAGISYSLLLSPCTRLFEQNGEHDAGCYSCRVGVAVRPAKISFPLTKIVASLTCPSVIRLTKEWRISCQASL